MLNIRICRWSPGRNSTMTLSYSIWKTNKILFIKPFFNLPWDVTGIGSSMTQDTDAVLYPSFRPLSWTCNSGKKRPLLINNKFIYSSELFFSLFFMTHSKNGQSTSKPHDPQVLLAFCSSVYFKPYLTE